MTWGSSSCQISTRQQLLASKQIYATTFTVNVKISRIRYALIHVHATVPVQFSKHDMHVHPMEQLTTTLLGNALPQKVLQGPTHPPPLSHPNPCVGCPFCVRLCALAPCRLTCTFLCQLSYMCVFSMYLSSKVPMRATFFEVGLFLHLKHGKKFCEP